MQPTLFFLPCLAAFAFAIAQTIASAFPNQTWILPTGGAIAAALVLLWVVLDRKGFARVFARKGTKYGTSSGLTVVFGIGIIVAIGYLSQRERFNLSVDISRDGISTLSDQSLKLVAEVQKVQTQEDSQPLRIQAFFEDPGRRDSFQDLYKLFRLAGLKAQIEYLDPRVHPSRAAAAKLSAADTVIWSLGDREARMTTFNEEQVANTLVNILKSETRRVYFMRGHGEEDFSSQSPEGYDLAVEFLRNQRYEVDSLNLLETGEIPEDADLVVIAGPQYDIKPEEAAMIEGYLHTGGAAFVLLDAMRHTPRLFEVLAQFGVSVSEDVILLNPDDSRALVFGQNNALVNSFDSFHPITRDFAQNTQVDMLMANARSLTALPGNPNNMKTTELANTSQEVVRLIGVRSEQDLAEPSEERFEAGSFPVMMAALGKVAPPKTALNDTKSGTENSAQDEQTRTDASGLNGLGLNGRQADSEIRLVVAGSSQFIRNNYAQVYSENLDLFTNTANFLLRDESFISIRPKDPKTAKLTLTSSTSQIALVFIAFLYPWAFLVTGLIRWLKRRSA